MVGKLFLVLITTALINNVVLSQFLGICPFLGVSKSTKTAAGMGGAVVFVITLSSLVSGILYKFVLEKLNLQYLTTIVFIIVIAFLVQLVEVFLKKAVPALYKSLGVYLPLITTNCAVLGTALTNVQQQNDILTGVVTGFGTAVGFTIAIVIMAGVREKTENNDYLGCFKGTPAVLMTACLMSIAFYGFNAFA
ncbi:MAG: RnfABCDGE type electron transport complex subunit A [Eubacteriales bacterium]|nr:RnfABCDGE type electron transport complex subunit A [Eubacteriales bacterium]